MTTAQGPSFCDYFRSFYYQTENTYHPPVDLSEETLHANGHIADDDSIPEPIRHKEVQAILSKPRSLDSKKTQEDGIVLARHGFTWEEHQGKPCLCTLSTKQGHTILHASTMNFQFAETSDRGERSYSTPEDRLLQIDLNERIKRAAGTQFKVDVPENSLILLDGHIQETELSKRYCILSAPFDSLSKAETIAKIQQMSSDEQITLATNLCVLIQKVGLAAINLHRFSFSTDGKISIDTSPVGVLVAKQSPVSRGESIEKCARIGLSLLLKDVRDAFGTTLEEGGCF